MHATLTEVVPKVPSGLPYTQTGHSFLINALPRPDHLEREDVKETVATVVQTLIQVVIEETTPVLPSRTTKQCPPSSMPRQGRCVTVQRPRIDARTLLQCQAHNIHHNPIFKSKINETSMDNDLLLIFSLSSNPVSAPSYIRHFREGKW